MKKILLTSLALSSILLAQADSDKLTTSANLGYVQTEGNTETTTYSLDATIKKGFGKNLFKLTFDGQYASQTVDGVDEDTKNKYVTELNYDYEYTPRLSFGYLAGFKQDRFSEFDYQAYTGPGIKYKVIKETKQNLSLASNILYARDRYDHGITANSAINEYTSLRLQLNYDYQILDNLAFTQDLTYRTDVEDTDQYFVTSKSELKSKISDKLSAGLSYKVDYTNQVASGIDHTDKTLTLLVGVDF